MPPEQAAIKRSNTLKLRWGLISLIAPTVLILATIVLYALSSFIFAATDSPASGDELFTSPSTGHVVVNIVLFLLGALGTLTWLPGIIVGIILLATRKTA